MTTPSFLTDGNKHPISALRLGSVHNITTSGISARTSTGMTSPILQLCATQDCYIKVGDSTVTAAAGTSTLLPAGAVLTIRVDEGQYVAAIQVTAGGSLNITELV